MIDNMNQRLRIIEQVLLRNQGQAIQNIKIPTHTLGSDTKAVTDTGLTTEVGMMVCANCHRVINDDSEYFVCHHCQSVLCSDCSIQHLNHAHCERCLRECHLDLKKKDYLVLACLINGVEDVKEISELALMNRDDVEQSLLDLRTLNLTSHERKFLGFLNELKITDEGMLALTLYRRIYGKDEDIQIFGQALRKHLAEKEEFRVGKS